MLALASIAGLFTPDLAIFQRCNLNTASVLEAAADIFGLQHGVNYVITDSWIFRTLLCFLLLLPLWPLWASIVLELGAILFLETPEGFCGLEPPSTKQVLSLQPCRSFFCLCTFSLRLCGI